MALIYNETLIVGLVVLPSLGLEIASLGHRVSDIVKPKLLSQLEGGLELTMSRALVCETRIRSFTSFQSQLST